MRLSRDEISNKKETAIELVICGVSDGEIAKRTRVSRKKTGLTGGDHPGVHQ